VAGSGLAVSLVGIELSLACIATGEKRVEFGEGFEVQIPIVIPLPKQREC
jgi:hypothetical protein